MTPDLEYRHLKTGTLIWDEDALGWDGEIELPLERIVLTPIPEVSEVSPRRERERMLTVTIRGVIDDDVRLETPTSSQRHALDYFFDHLVEIENAVADALVVPMEQRLTEVVELTRKQSEKKARDLEERIERFSLHGPKGVRQRAQPTSLMILPHEHEATAFYQLGVDCAWDARHGTAILFWKGRILAISNYTFFDESPEELKELLENRQRTGEIRYYI